MLGRLVLLLSLLVLAAPAAAATVLALELAELVSESDHVVTAVAVAEDVHRDARGRIVTDVTLEVAQRLKGPTAVGGELRMRTLGGVIGDLGMRVPGEPSLAMGSEHVLFLRDGDEACRAVGMSQGALRISEENGERTVNPGASGLRLVERNGGRLVPGAAAILHPMPLADFIAQVQDIVRSQQGADPSATQ